ncbi:MAG: lipopolysaccharide biosynthesis protein [Hyphomicrobium sp.]|uniref:lipopolysaccharide biosynthesis protein n=1 Tax=Hyphomicrobium sp. TaxID=82 RepID=UPI00356901D2
MPNSIYFQPLRDSDELGRKALRGGAISVVGTYGSAILQIGAAVVLARLLTPDDFGLVAIVTVLTSFAPFLIDFGLGDATMQRREITEGNVSSLFWLSTAIGAAIALLVAISGPVIAWLYRDPRLEPIAFFSALPFLLVGMTGQHMALLRRTMQFTMIARIQILATLAGVAIAIPLALHGAGYWALVARPIVNALLVAIGAWLACSWRPGLPESGGEVASMVRFGMHVVGFSTTVAVARSVDRIALGLFYSPHDVGLYQNALVFYDNSIVNTLAQVHTVGSTALGKLQASQEALRRKFYSALSVLSFYVMPAAAIISVTAHDFVVTILGEKWRESGLILSILAVRGIFHVVHSSQGWLHLAIGRPDRWRNWGVMTASAQVLAVLAGLPFGPIGVAIAVSIAGSLMAFPAITYAGKPVGIDATSAFHAVKAQLIASVLILLAGWFLQDLFPANFSGVARMLLSGLFCSLLYLSIVAGLFHCTEPIKVAGKLLEDHLPASWRKRV